MMDMETNATVYLNTLKKVYILFNPSQMFYPNYYKTALNIAV